jgi:hypothetical protein
MSGPLHAHAREVEAAARVMYGLAPGRQDVAIQWLNAAVGSPGSWAALRELLGSPEPAIAFFAANALATKVRREWRLLGEADRASTAALLWDAAFAADADRSVMRRACLGVAAAAAAGGGPGVADIMTALVPLVMAMRPHDVMVALEIIRLLPEEADAADAAAGRGGGGGAASLTSEMGALGPDMLGFLSALLAGDGSPLAMSALSDATAAGVVAVLGCLESWARVGVGLAEVAEGGGALYAAVLHGLTCAQEAVVGAAADALCELVRRRWAPPPPALGPAVEALASTLGGTRGRGYADAGARRRVAALAAALVEHHVEYAVSGGAASNGLLELLLGFCGEPGDRELLIVCVDAWLVVQGVPVAARAPDCGAPLFERLLAIVVEQVRYPEGASGAICGGGGGGDGDEEGCGEDRGGASLVDDAGFAALRARDSGVQELLESAFGLLYTAGVDVAGSLLGRARARGGGGGWRDLEAVLFVLGALGPDIARSLTRPADSARGTAAQGRLSASCGDVLGAVTALDAAASPPALVAGGARLIAALAGWLPRAAGVMPGLLEGSLGFAFAALRVPGGGGGAARAGAAAVAGIARSSAAGLASDAALAFMMAELERAGGVGLGTRDRETALTAVCGVVGVLPTHAARAAAVEALLGPYVARLRELAAGGGGGGAGTRSADALVTSEASLLGAGLTALCPGGGGEAHPAIALLPEALPALCALVGGAGAAGVDAALVALGAAFTAARCAPGVVSTALPPAADAILGAFRAHARAAVYVALEGLAGAAGAAGDPGAVARLIAAGVDAAVAWAGAAPDAPVRCPDVVGALFDFATAVASEALPPLLSSGALPHLLRFAAAAMTLSHQEAVRSCTRFVLVLLSDETLRGGGGGADAAAAVLEAVGAAGEEMTDAVLVALAGGGTTRGTTGALGEVLYVLARAGGDGALGWVGAALARRCAAAAALAESQGWRPEEGMVPSGLAGLDPRGQAGVIKMLRNASAGRSLQRFRSIVADIAKVAEGTLELDGLLGYEID